MTDNTTSSGVDALPDSVRVPLHSLHADAAYLVGRLRRGTMADARVVEIIRERVDAAIAALSAAQEVQAQALPTCEMTAHRAMYFMERFKREEKLLGPNEQAAVDFVLAMLAAAPATPQPAQQPLTEAEVMAAFDDEADDDDAAPFVFLAGVRFAERKHLGIKND